MSLLPNGKQADRQTGRQAGRQAGRQTDRQTDIINKILLTKERCAPLVGKSIKTNFSKWLVLSAENYNGGHLIGDFESEAY